MSVVLLYVLPFISVIICLSFGLFFSPLFLLFARSLNLLICVYFLFVRCFSKQSKPLCHSSHFYQVCYVFAFIFSFCVHMYRFVVYFPVINLFSSRFSRSVDGAKQLIPTFLLQLPFTLLLPWLSSNRWIVYTNQKPLPHVFDMKFFLANCFRLRNSLATHRSVGVQRRTKKKHANISKAHNFLWTKR